MKRVAVFCGSNPGTRPAYAEAARRLAQTLVRRGIGLVYGGSGIGTMGILARAAVEAGGEVIGVIPRLLVDREVALVSLPDLRIVDSMHERKALMAELADAFIALPGGIGTMDEFFEMVSWTQLGLQRKPCGLLDVCGYYRPLIAFLDHAVEQGFIKPEYRPIILTDDDPDGLLDRLEDYLTSHVRPRKIRSSRPDSPS
ncbi:MAG: TIGR00730 family Rossman fold protein [Armatimonadota bacterium]|nr:TIGR00730 family Rossman fold protein [Armatimonadota bacterium]MDR7548866.1 TIGR00730 family Rossman fold protein [Armatimonadota bacterium]